MRSIQSGVVKKGRMIMKRLEELKERYDLDPYIKQRLVLVREEISSIFAVPEETMKNNTTGQFNLGRYM